jgi:selenocysteine lyase/cysteine desulfurase
VNAFAEEALVVDAAVQQRWTMRVEEVRAAFAALVGARAEEIAFVKNTSEGLSLVAAGIEWKDGDNVIAVDSEYPANVYPWWGLRRWGVETRMVSPRGGLVHVEDLAALADRRTRLLSVSFVDWSSGARNDLAAIGEWCRSRGILFCVDGIQGVGAVRLDVEAFGIDFLAVGGHKWLLAPEGCGCLYVSSRVVERLHSVLLGWKSVNDADNYFPYHFDPRADAGKFEPGSPSVLSTVALGAALDLLHEVGAERIERRLMEITGELAAGLRGQGAEILGPWGDAQRSGIVVFRPRHGDPAALAAALNARGIVVRPRGGGVRVAPHFYNNRDDIERLLAAV